MDYLINKHDARLLGEVRLSPSKSESNRALLIDALAGGKISLKNLSDAQDTEIMEYLLKYNPQEWDIIDAGTAMRFLTAYLAMHGDNKILTGSARMQERPIRALVDALKELGAEIKYLGKKGYPPLQISAITEQQADTISIPGNISSQFVSALLMIAPSLPKGLKIKLTTEVFSKPYIEMTLDLMRAFGAECKWAGDTITVKNTHYLEKEYVIEGDWSGASYWYSFVALSNDENSMLTIPSLRTYSSQGDKRISEIMFELGIVTDFINGKIRLTKKEIESDHIKLDMRDCPDLAQTVMVVAAVKGVSIEFKGLESLKIKETNRVKAMKKELKKIGADLIEEESTWLLKPTEKLPEQVEIATYNDHRMAMAFAPLCQLMDVVMKDPGVVRKSYPGFWEEVKNVGVRISPH